MFQFNSDAIAPHERFEVWGDFLDRTLMPIRIEPAKEHAFYIELGSRFIGDVPLEVSTVWIGINHNFSGEGPPLIFETMVFGSEGDLYCERYATEEQAREGHAATLRRLIEVDNKQRHQ